MEIVEGGIVSLLVCNGRKKIQGGLGMTDEQFVCMVGQLSHFGWSALVITWAAILSPKHFYWAWGLWTLLTACKEFWFDFNIFTWSPGFEDNKESGGPLGDLLDFSMYTIGALVGFLAVKHVGLV